MADATSGVAAADFSESVDASFHGIEYLLTIHTVNGDTMCIEVEQKDDASRWRGDFTSRYIEDITSKTGNFKKFHVFVRMLLSAVKQASESVFVDLLTYQDLEVLKQRKQQQQGAQQQAGSRSLVPNNKRYLILTYAAEFDRVHYPLPLVFEENPDPQRLRSIIASLRAELATAQQQQQAAGRQTVPGSGEAPAEMKRLREENSALRQQLRLLDRSMRPDQDAGGPGEPGAKEVAKELRAVRKERDLLQARVEAAEAELERERGLHRRELRRKAKEAQEAYEELSRSREAVRSLKEQVRQLMVQLEALRASGRASGPSERLRSAYSRGAAPDRSGVRSANSRGPSPGRGGPPLYGPAGHHDPRNSAHRANTTSSRERGGVGVHGYGSSASSRPTSAPATGRFPSPHAGGQRFDPTEYVMRQRREMEERRMSRGGGSAPGSRAPTPPRSVASSGRASPAAGPSRPGSSERERERARGLSPAGSRHGSLDGGRAGAPRGSGRARAGSPSAGAWSKFPLNTAALQQQGRDGMGPGSRPQSAERAASPGRALQEVKRKLSEYATARRSSTGEDLSATSSLQNLGATLPRPSSAAATAGAPALGAAVDQASKSQLFNDASAEIADIDSRLHALQNFLRMAKASAPSSAAT